MFIRLRAATIDRAAYFPPPDITLVGALLRQIQPRREWCSDACGNRARDRRDDQGVGYAFRTYREHEHDARIEERGTSQ